MSEVSVPSSVPPKGRVRKGVKKGVYLLPSLLTIGNLLSGFYAIVAVYNDEYWKASMAILVAFILDGLDGAVARLTGAQSDFGIELDSLADLVSFGVAPAILAHVWAIKPYSSIAWLFGSIVPTALFVSCGAFRLARFNIQTRSLDKRYFVGLPIPAAALAVTSFILLMGEPPFLPLLEVDGLFRQGASAFMVVLVYLLSFLMVSRLRYRSLKGIEIKRRQPFAVLVGLTLLLLLVASRPSLILFICSFIYIVSGPARSILRRRAGLEPGEEAAFREGKAST